MDDLSEPSGTCVCCARRDPLPGLEPVCGVCRSTLVHRLAEIPELCMLLAAGPRAQVVLGALTDVRELVLEFGDDETLEVAAVNAEDALERIAGAVRTHQARSVAVAAGPIPGQSSAPRVGGSRERPMPIRADAVDLLDVADDARVVSDYHHVPMVRSTGEQAWQTTWFDGLPIRQLLRVREVVSTPRQSRCRCGRPELHERHRPVMVPAADQIGRISVASVLNSWVRDFCEARREHGPEPVVPALVRYLLDRLDWAYEVHTAVDEFFHEIHDLWRALYAATGLTEPRPELCVGVACPSCDMRTLWRVPSSIYIECACGHLLTEDEYRAWTRLCAAAVRQTTPQEATV
jgi:hypothetical protein